MINQDNPIGAAGILFYGAATAVAIASYVFMDSRSKFCQKNDGKPASALPAVALVVCSFMFCQFKFFPAMGIAFVNMIINLVLMSRPSKQLQQEAKKNPQLKGLIIPTGYIPSPALQKKLDAVSKAANQIYDEELAKFDKAFHAKLAEFDRQIAAIEKEMAEEEKVAKAKYNDEMKKIQAQTAEADRIFANADFLREEDKTADCVGFLYRELSEGRATTLKQALIAYDAYLEERKASLARLDSLAILTAQTIAEHKREKEEEERLHKMRMDNIRMEKELREQQRKIERERKNQ